MWKLMFVMMMVMVMVMMVMVQIAFSFITIRISLWNAEYSVDAVSVMLAGGHVRYNRNRTRLLVGVLRRCRVVRSGRR